jgi:hypothetical protein
MSSGTQSPAGGEVAVVGAVAAPNEVRASFVLWLAAVAAGVFETILTIIEAVSGQLALGTGGVIVGVSMRLLIFTVVVYVASRMLRGRNWARFVLAIGLGVLGTLSIVIGPVSWLAEGHTIGEFVAGADLMVLLFASSRVVHLIGLRGAGAYVPAGRQRLLPGCTIRKEAGAGPNDGGPVGAQVAICRESAWPRWRAWSTPAPPRDTQRTGEPARKLELTAFTGVRGRGILRSWRSLLTLGLW